MVVVTCRLSMGAGMPFANDWWWRAPAHDTVARRLTVMLKLVHHERLAVRLLTEPRGQGGASGRPLRPDAYFVGFAG